MVTILIQSTTEKIEFYHDREGLVLGACLSQDFYCCDKVLGPKVTWGGKVLFQFPDLYHSSPLQEVRAGNQRLVLKHTTTL